MPQKAPIGLSYDDWMAAFLSVDEVLDSDRKYDGMFKNIDTDMGERNCLRSFVDAVNVAQVLGEFVLALAYGQDDEHHDEGQKRLAGVAMYPKGCLAIDSQRTDWAAVEVFICYRRDESCGPYGENAHRNVLSDDTSREALEDTMTYASTVFEYQQRTHHFGVVLVGSWAWLERWDHAGVVRSSTFDYQQDPAKLARFLSRVAHASAEARGHDTTATRVLEPSADHDILRNWAAKAEDYVTDPRLAKDDYVGKLFADSLNQARAWWRIRVADEKHGVKDFLVGKPTFAAPGVVGRGTRGYIGLSISDPGAPFVYLKDCWRVVHDRSEREGDILSYLNSQGVTNIPTALYHGDVGNQRTVSQDLYLFSKPGGRAGVVNHAVETMEVDEVAQTADRNQQSVKWVSADSGPGSKDRAAEVAGQSAEAGDNGKLTQDSRGNCPLSKHRHYRLVVKEVGLPLHRFPSGRILVWSIHDAIIAHQDAYEKAKVMHCDISVGNILIIPPTSKNGKTTYQGLLADWELSKRLDEYQKDTRIRDRMGTWQFMSVNVQDNPKAQVEIADELESFLLVMIYCAIRYLPHTCQNVGEFIHHFFDDSAWVDETEYTCGPLKRMVMDSGVLKTLTNRNITFLRRPRNPHSGPLTADDRHPIDSLIMALLKHLSARYALAKRDRGKLVSSVEALLAEIHMKHELDKQEREAQPQTSLAGLFTQLPKYIARGVVAARDALFSSSYVAAYLDEKRTRYNSQKPVESPEELYKGIQTHSLLIYFLDTASEELSSLWPGPEDRLPDQLKPKRTSEKRTAPEGETTGRPFSKRRRVDGAWA
ncbi:hypothetical protein PYCCODRAFT_1460340 [Trametes coccinea BRFM310]|uniref:Fungal-type protein kinase domain-containing protein n=1 Tax=Trametes coccinea (strain BRFM310) TaxID=1353009 RepID=A0A1Y2IK19_TRAC3|nr:hypothetical protein PYCCODRAFT_1460340 [Trametes coccinea BRFM310]